jgi:hypothetical protein
VVAVGAHLRHTGLTDWGGSWSPTRVSTSPGMPLAAHRGPSRQHRGAQPPPPAIRSTPSPQVR